MPALRSHVHRIAALAMILGALGCNSSTTTYALGNLSAQVVDANNAGVQGVAADLYRVLAGGSLLWRASSTSSNGVAVFGASDGGVVAGDYYIHLTFPSAYAFAAGETNDRPVTVKEGDNLVVTFHVVPKGPGA
jgi:hypothetical protein